MKKHPDLWRVWQTVAEAAPRRFAMLDAASGEARTFRSLSREAGALSGVFAAARDSAVAFCLPNSFAWMSVFLGLQRAGAGALPLDAEMPEPAREESARAFGASFFWNGRQMVRLFSRKKAQPGVTCIKTTSGSTGRPQALPCRAGHLMADGRNVIATMGIRRHDRNLGLIPFGHSYGLGNLVLPLILQGTTLAFAAGFVPAQIPEWIRRHCVTVFPSVPAVFRILAQLPGRSRLRPLRLAISAGAPLDAVTARDFHARFGVRLHNFYGSSETGGICYDRTGEAAGASVGRPLENVAVRVMRGNRLEIRSKAVVLTGGRFVLPDRGEWDGQGNLRLLGRAQAVANLGGRKVNPAEIEEVLSALPGCGEVSVLVLHRNGRDYLAAFAESARPTRDIGRCLREVLPSWKLPRRLIVRARLPRNARGKLDAAALRRLAEAGATE